MLSLSASETSAFLMLLSSMTLKSENRCWYEVVDTSRRPNWREMTLIHTKTITRSRCKLFPKKTQHMQHYFSTKST